MSLLDRFGLAMLRQFDPETAHGLAVKALKAGLVPLPGPVSSPRLRTRLAGLDLPNPVGLAAGFDKHAEVIAPLLRAGFGFIEVGGVTPRPQPGNPRPRLFRLTEDRAVINRFGFNSVGMEAMAPRLEARPETGVVGLNLGANKDSADKARDFSILIARLGGLIDFATVNVSSPNTESLRDLQGKAALRGILEDVQATAGRLPRPIPIFVKIAPDLDSRELRDVADAASEAGISGIIATNTTLSREGLKSRHRGETGGLSGRPLFIRSTQVLGELHRMTEGRVPLIGVGGISSAEDAYAKIRAGAGAVQLYSALVYQGLGLAAEIARGLDRLLERDGCASVAEAVGADHAG